MFSARYGIISLLSHLEIDFTTFFIIKSFCALRRGSVHSIMMIQNDDFLVEILSLIQK